MENTLYGFYQAQGQALPSVQQRQGTATQAGIQNYTGTSQQNAQLLNFLRGNTATSGVKTTSNSMTPGGTINASQLGTTANTQVPPPITTNTAQQNLGTQTTAFTEGIAGNQQMQQQQAQAQQVITPANSRQGILDKISSLLGVQATQGEESAKIFEGEGVQAKKDLVRNLENEALAKERAYQKQAEKIRMNPEGKLESGIQIDLNNLERQRNSELADIAIQSKIAQGNYQSAFEIADAKVKAQFEPIENQIKSLQMLYGLYQNDLSESEKMEAQAKIQERQASLDFARQKELLRYKAQIDASQLVDAGSLDPEVLKTNQYKAIEALAPAYRAIQNYKDAVKKWGTKEVLSGAGKGELQSAYGDAIAAWKTLAGLGALSGADFGLAENVIPEPARLARSSTFQSQLDGALSRASGQANFLGSSLKRAYPTSIDGIDQTLMQALGGSAENDPLGLGIGGGGSNSNPLGI